MLMHQNQVRGTSNEGVCEQHKLIPICYFRITANKP